jgi:hypothetical protein
MTDELGQGRAKARAHANRCGARGGTRPQAHRGPKGHVEGAAYRLQKRLGVVVMKVVPAAGELHETGPLHCLEQGLAVRDGDNGISIAPEHHDRRQIAEFVRAAKE